MFKTRNEIVSKTILDNAFNLIDLMIKDHYKPERVLNIISLSDDKASQSYINNKVKQAELYNVQCKVHKPKTKAELISLIKELAKDDNNRIIIQSPFDETEFGTMRELMKLVPKHMDIDGFDMNLMDITNIRTLGDVFFNPNISPTAKGVIAMMIECQAVKNSENLYGERVTVIGSGLTSGLPIAAILTRLGCTVNWHNSKTRTVYEDYLNSDYIIACAGKNDLINEDYSSEQPHACYINVGMSANEEGKLKGDINYNEIIGLDNTLFANKLFGTTGLATCKFLILNTVL